MHKCKTLLFPFFTLFLFSGKPSTMQCWNRSPAGKNDRILSGIQLKCLTVASYSLNQIFAQMRCRNAKMPTIWQQGMKITCQKIISLPLIQSHLFEVFIEKSVKDGVGADRGDANDVEEHEESHHVLRCVKHIRCLSHQAEQAGMEEVKVEAGTCAYSRIVPPIQLGINSTIQTYKCTDNKSPRFCFEKLLFYFLNYVRFTISMSWDNWECRLCLILKSSQSTNASMQWRWEGKVISIWKVLNLKVDYWNKKTD